MSTATAEPAEQGVEHDDHGHEHPEWLAHHFETAEQQFDAGKLGIWLFLAQEVLFFTGLFVAYAVYRMNHPEVFRDAANFLNPTLGALNTIVLLASSLAIAWGVRCAQKNQREMLLWMHIFTLGCAGVFMGVKIVEYSYKFDEGLYWAGMFEERALIPGEGLNAALPWVFIGAGLIGGLLSLGGWMMYRLNSGLGSAMASFGWLMTALITGLGIASLVASEDSMAGAAWLKEASPETVASWSSFLYPLTAISVTALLAWGMKFFVRCFKGDRRSWGAVALGLGMCIAGTAAGIVVARGIQLGTPAHHGEHAHHEDHAAGHGEDDHGESHAEEAQPAASKQREPGVNKGNFFSIYFAMTGVHALHIFAGIVVIAWITGRIARGDFSPDFYGPVEFVGLYWHLVDLVWIYLFPLLYLIH